MYVDKLAGKICYTILKLRKKSLYNIIVYEIYVIGNMPLLLSTLQLTDYNK